MDLEVVESRRVALVLSKGDEKVPKHPGRRSRHKG